MVGAREGAGRTKMPNLIDAGVALSKLRRPLPLSSGDCIASWSAPKVYDNIIGIGEGAKSISISIISIINQSSINKSSCTLWFVVVIYIVRDSTSEFAGHLPYRNNILLKGRYSHPHRLDSETWLGLILTLATCHTHTYLLTRQYTIYDTRWVRVTVVEVFRLLPFFLICVYLVSVRVIFL